MRVLLDESLPRGLKSFLKDHEVVTVPERGWASKSNGELLALAGADFDVFITADQKLEHQQNLAGIDVGIVVLAAASNRLAAYIPLREKLLSALNTVRAGEVVRIVA